MKLRSTGKKIDFSDLCVFEGAYTTYVACVHIHGKFARYTLVTPRPELKGEGSQDLVSFQKLGDVLVLTET